MSKVTMPEPVILRTVMPDDYRYGHVYGFTRKHMEAYADARVREVLEQAADICAGIAIPTHRDAQNKSAALECAIAIRRLIPQQ